MSAALLIRALVSDRVCFGQPSQRLFDLLSRRVRALDVLQNLLLQQHEPCGTASRRVSHLQARVASIMGQSFRSIFVMRSLASMTRFFSDRMRSHNAILTATQPSSANFARLSERSAHAQPGIGQFEAKNINHHHTASFAVPSIVNRRRSHLFRQHAAHRRDGAI